MKRTEIIQCLSLSAAGFLFFFGLCFASAPQQQKKTQVFKTAAYTSYYNYTTHCPDSVVYKLYKGGGQCSRAGMAFKADSGTAREKDYAHNGYDEGHCCPAEDFAYDCDRERQTFRFINCMPQTANLNRGQWKHYETLIRKASQTDSLLIICGPTFPSVAEAKTIGPNKVWVPASCWKRVISLTTGKTIWNIELVNN